LFTKHISLKWKALAFQFIVLTLLTLAWAWVTTDKQISLFNQELRETHKEHTVILGSSIDDSLVELELYSQLIINKVFAVFTGADVAPSSDQLQKELDEQWLRINVTLDVDYLSIYDESLRKLVQKQSIESDTLEGFQETLQKNLQLSKLNAAPQKFIFCREACYFMIVEPFITSGKQRGFIVLAQNISGILATYFNFSADNVGILIGGEKGDYAEGTKQNFSSERKFVPWAVSNYPIISPVINAFLEGHDLPKIGENKSFFHDKKRYLIRQINLTEKEILGNQVRFVSISDKTKDYAALTNNIKRAAIFGLLALLLSTLVLLYAIRSPINKLKEIGEALNLMPRKMFTKALDKLDNDTKYPDEITFLETNTSRVIKKLQGLYKTLDEKNVSLNEQVAALSRSRAFLTRLFDNSQIFIVTQKFDSTILSSNKKFDSLLHEPPKLFSSFLSDVEEIDEFNLQVQFLKNHQIDAFSQQVNTLDKRNKPLITSWTHSIVEDEQGDEILLSIGMDQTREKNAESNLRWVVNHDSLTSIGNRRAFHHAFSKMISRSESGALLVMDVNRLTQINEIYGQSAGDQVLLDVVAKLKKVATNEDSIYRFAGDEFTALFRSVAPEKLTTFLLDLNSDFNSPIELENGQTISYTMSMGAAFFPEEGAEYNEKSITANAKLAMQNAKKKGLGNWQLYDAKDQRLQQIRREHDVILSIKHALKHDKFELSFQPIMSISDNEISHYEALIRLQDESNNNVSPALFIPIAEKTGEIRAIDEWVVESCLATLSQLNKKDCQVNFSINISTPTLQSNDFPRFLFECVKQYGIE